MVTIIGLSGSLRAGSFNTMLLGAAIEVAPAGATVEVATIRGIPLYDGDAEAATGVPPAVQALKDQIAAADGLLVASPEYNNSMPGVLKNAIDWLSRPAGDVARVFGDLPVGVIGATPGRGATSLAQAAWLPVFRTLGALHYTGRLGVAQAASSFTDGRLTDATIRGLLAKYMAGFVAFVERHARVR